MKSTEPLLFLQFVKSKNRTVVYTRHALHRAEQRFLNPAIAENDLLNQTPVKVLEQESELVHERKFNVYYLQKNETFHRYVICLNNQIRVITMLRTSKKLQNWLFGAKK